MLRVLVLIGFSIFSSQTLAAPEALLEANWDHLIDQPWQQCKTGEFQDELVPSKSIAYRRCGGVGSMRPVIIVPGYTEPAMKYVELMSDLSSRLPQLGPWYLLDLPGQGASERLVDTKGIDQRLVHVDIPDRYPQSVVTLVKKIILPENKKNHPLAVSHSTGALVLMAALRQSPDLIRAAVMTAPLIKPKMPLPQFVVAELAAIHCRLGFCAYTAWGRAPEAIQEKTFEKNVSTSSKARWSASHRIGIKYPGYYSSGTTWGWLNMAMILGREVASAENPMGSQVLMLMAEDDSYIDPPAAIEACKKSKACTFEFMGKSRHEIFHEIDSIRDKALEKVARFFGANVR